MPTPSRFQGTPKRLGSTTSSFSSSSTTTMPSRTPSTTTPSKHPFSSSSSAHHNPSSTNTPGSASKRDSCLEQIQLLQHKRAERRKSMEEKRAERAKEEKRLHDSGMPGDVDFQRMIGSFRTEHGLEPHPHIPPGDLKICICVRKRPINEKERKRKDYDAVTCFNPVVMVHDCRLRVDGITKYLENTDFAFDHTFGEEETTEELYRYTAAPLVPFMFQQGRATCFAYGQTGSGKTFTMCGIQKQVVADVFAHLGDTPSTAQAPGGLAVFVSYFEIYGGRCQDLLNERHRLLVREDGKGDVVIGELCEKEAGTEGELWGYIEEGNRNRTTHATEVNDVSSRSHAVCQIVLRGRETGKMWGKLSLVDLAGSERGGDTKSHCRQRRLESAEINKSLLALKECVRALDTGGSTHVPYRASKLTLVLKDCFSKEKARTVMIATVSPNASSADHTLNTLRYADRVKQKNAEDFNAGGSGVGRVKGGGKTVEEEEEEAAAGGEAGLGLDGDFEDEDGGLGEGGEEGEEGLFEDEEELGEEEGGIAGEMEGMAVVGEPSLTQTQTPVKKAVTRSFSSPAPSTTSSSLTPSSSSMLRRTPVKTKLGPPVRLAPSTALKAARGTCSNGSSSNDSSSSSSGTNHRPSLTPTTTPIKPPRLQPGGSSTKKTPSAAAAAAALMPPPPPPIDAKRPVARKIPSHGDDDDVEEEGRREAQEQHQRSVQEVYEEEEALLNLHMDVIQENAELLTEEGMLLQQVQKDGVEDYDLDMYTLRLDEILARKMDLIGDLRGKLSEFRTRLQQEESAANQVIGGR